MSSRDDGLASPPSLSKLILSDGTPKLAFIAAIIIGTILIAINQGDTILDGHFPPLWKVILTYCVPYCAATWGALTEKRAQWVRKNQEQLQARIKEQ